MFQCRQFLRGMMTVVDDTVVGMILEELRHFSSRRYEMLSDAVQDPDFYVKANALAHKLSVRAYKAHSGGDATFDPPTSISSASALPSKLLEHCPVYVHFQSVIDSLLIAHTQALWNTMFESCSTDDGKHLSRKDRQLLKNSSSTLIYGEIAYDSYCHIMWSALADLQEEQEVVDEDPRPWEPMDPFALSHRRRGGVYYDLGSGTGRALLASVMVHTFHKIVGIEILPSLHEAAEHCLSVYNDMASRGEVPTRTVELVCGSFFEYDWSDGDVIFANSTCYSDDMFVDIARQCASLRDGALVITFSVQLEAPYLQLMALKNYTMSWGDASVYIHRKINVDNGSTNKMKRIFTYGPEFGIINQLG